MESRSVSPSRGFAHRLALLEDGHSVPAHEHIGILGAMCANYRPSRRNDWLEAKLGISLPAGDWRKDAFPSHCGPMVRLRPDRSPEAVLARFELVPHWAIGKDPKGLRRYSLFNARFEEVEEKKSYRPAWLARRYGLALADAYYEFSYDTGSPVRWRIERKDGQPMPIACIWNEHVVHDTAEIITSFSMLTISGEGHPVASRFHAPGDPKRMPWIVPEAELQAWLETTPEQAPAMTKQYPSELMATTSDPLPARAKRRLDDGTTSSLFS